MCIQTQIVEKKASLWSIVCNHLLEYPTPANLNYAWSFGSLAGIFFALQLATGIFLARHYTSDRAQAFNSVEHIRRDVNFGLTLRYRHANGASFIFIRLYIHIGKALYYRSYTHLRSYLFFSGIVLFLLRRGTAFIGYVLPWGQRSFWGATVITNLITAVPYRGESIANWVWGGFSVGYPTLTRFFSAHYLLPFIITGLIFLHLILLHENGSSNPLGLTPTQTDDKLSFFPYFFFKDAVALTVALSVFRLLIHFFPNLLGHSDNYILANPLVTPSHIVPEWYFLPFYAILRAIPDKIGGVLARLGSILVLFTLPLLDFAPLRSPRRRLLFNYTFFLFVADFFLLRNLGGQAAEEPFITASRIATVLYFSFFLLFVPSFILIEQVKIGVSAKKAF